MVAKVRTIEIEPDSALANGIREANGAPVVLIVNGTRYVLRPEEALTPATFEDDEDTRRFLANLERRRAEYPDEDGWEGHDPERVRQVLDEVAGTLSDEEVDRWIEAVYRARQEGSRPFERPGPT